MALLDLTDKGIMYVISIVNFVGELRIFDSICQSADNASPAAVDALVEGNEHGFTCVGVEDFL